MTTIDIRQHRQNNNSIERPLFPLYNCDGVGNKKSVDWKHPRLEKFDALAMPGTVWWNDYQPLDIVMNTDMSFTWKYLGRGGAAKVKKYFCHCCTLKSENIVVPNDKRCSKWCDLNSPLPCYHQTFANNTNMEEYRRIHQQLGTILTQRMRPLEDICKRSRLNSKEDPRRSSEVAKKSIDSIHFEFWQDEVSDEQKRLYARNLTYDLILRDMPVPELLIDQQASLRDIMRMEYQYLELGEAIAESDEERVNTIALINNVPCILHMENRIGIKILATVVQRGLSKALDKILFPDINDVGRRFDAFFASINHIANTIILGTADNPSQWECPCDRMHRELGIICLDNTKTRKFVNGI